MAPLSRIRVSPSDRGAVGGREGSSTRTTRSIEPVSTRKTIGFSGTALKMKAAIPSEMTMRAAIPRLARTRRLCWRVRSSSTNWNLR